MLDSVLVLNANFEPIHICNIRRAISLILDDKASLVLNGRGYVHSVSASFPIPSVIRLDKMIQRPRPVVQLTRAEVFRRDNFTCQYCGSRVANLTIDHVIPRRANGPHIWTNVVTACMKCNHQKGARTPEQANMTLLHKPEPPPRTIQYYFQTQLKSNLNWEEFITGW